MQMVPCLQDAAEWEALYNASQKLKVMLELAGAEDVAESEDGQCSEAPPDLQLSSYIPDIQEALRQHLPSAVGFQELVDMYERSLISDARHLQATFESGWTECKGVDVAVMQGRQALIRLHTVAFKEAAAYRKEVILARLRGQQDMQTDSVGEKGCEWTDETRALMERVYQQHPKLGAHEKKVLSEVSGLSLRQISIWVSSCTASLYRDEHRHARAFSCGFCLLVRARVDEL